MTKSRVPDLPNEILIEVTKQFGLVSHPGQYIIPGDQRQALTNLCRTNHFFNICASEVLHKRVHVTSNNIEDFVIRVRGAGTTGTPKVKFISFAGFGNHITDRKFFCIIYILDRLPLENLTHILFDLPLRSFYQVPSPNDKPPSLVLELTNALTSFPNVEEFISVQDEAYLLGWLTGPVLWPHWPVIRRLALYNPEILEEVFIEGIVESTTLQKLFVLNPRLVGGAETDDEFAELIDEASPDTAIVFLDADNLGDASTDGDYVFLAKEEEHLDPLLRYVKDQPERVYLVDVDAITDKHDKRGSLD
ncbi:hypothetical protein FRB90_008912, partial [Tulasnella sp. 427]